MGILLSALVLFILIALSPIGGLIAYIAVLTLLCL
jgi:hypothetical protein